MDARCCYSTAWNANDICKIAVGCPRTVMITRIRILSYINSYIYKIIWAKVIYWCHNPSESMVVTTKALLHSCLSSLYGQWHSVCMLTEYCFNWRQCSILDAWSRNTRRSTSNVAWIWAHIHRSICIIGWQKYCPRQITRATVACFHTRVNYLVW